MRCLPRSQFPDGRIISRTFDPAVPALVVVGAVLVVFLVGFVVLLVVGHEIPQREAVVGDDEVDAGERFAPAAFIQIAAAGKPIRQLARLPSVALPVAPDGIPVFAVPFRPTRGKVSDLITAFADVPWLGDQFELREDRVLLNDVQETAESVHVMQLAGEGRRQIEAEAIHMHLKRPVPQAIHDELERSLMLDVERVTACPCSRGNTAVDRA